MTTIHVISETVEINDGRGLRVYRPSWASLKRLEAVVTRLMMAGAYRVDYNHGWVNGWTAQSK